MSNLKSAAWYGGGTGGGVMLPGANWVDNSVFYVDDQNGTDVATNNNGLTPDNAFQTITYALTQAALVGGIPYIIVLNYGHDPTLEGWPITIDVNNVQLVAAEVGTWSNPPVNIQSDGDTDCLSIEANNVRVRGFYIYPGYVANCITFAGSVQRPCIEDNAIVAGDYGIYSPTGGVGFGCAIRRNQFSVPVTGGIYFNDDAANTITRENIFLLSEDSFGMHFTAGGNNFILDNRFVSKDIVTPATGWAIYLSGVTTTGLVDGNHATMGLAEPGANPYRDTSVAGTNGWGDNYMGILATYPVNV